MAFVFPIKEKKVTFASYRSKSLEGNLKYLYKEMVNQHPDYQYHFLIKKFKGSFIGKVDYFLHMLKSIYGLATSKYFIVDDYYFPIYVIKPRDGSEIIQLWHAAGAFKKFGLSTVGKSFGPSPEYLNHVKIHSNYSKVYVSSKNVIPYYSEAFGLEEDKIHPLGVPRTDFFFEQEYVREAEERFFLQYPEFINKKVILYAPTFRGGSHNQEAFDCPLDIRILKEVLGEKYTLLIHLHPYMKESMIVEDESDFVTVMDSEFTIEELMIVSDILITDFSSIVFDFSLLEKPIAFYATDLEEYMLERDFYFDFETFIPGPFFTDTYQLANWIQQGQYDKDLILKFKDFFFDGDKRVSQKIVSHIFSEK